jgi:CDP-paratose 2-epimerase
MAYVLVTGGAGFIGANLANRLLSEGERVVLYDDLSRPNVERNLAWLRGLHGDRVAHVRADVRDAVALAEAVSGASRVFHLAAQVAVTTSLESPTTDLEVNTLGTLRLLEAVRARPRPPSVIFTSTNKVYGSLDDVVLARHDGRWEPVSAPLREGGISEARPLAFHSPYGCSKGAADQYVLDYARTFGLRAAVCRMSCIYGPRQFGTEDQGWVAHFVKRAIEGKTITLYGDGLQVRDVLFVDDLVDALLAVEAALPAVAGEAFNVGGGPASTVSLVELLRDLEVIARRAPAIAMAEARPADQRWYVSDTRKLTAATGWRARVGPHEGVRRLHAWLTSGGP